jgi:8-amino-7-oxononanoate synthase
VDFEAALADLEAAGLKRRRRVVRGLQGPMLDVDGEPMLAFASNDYLGLASHPEIIEATIAAARRCGVGGGASHLISGHHEEHELAEEALARFVDLPRALLFSSGYMANTGVIPALVGRGGAVFSDTLNHACLIDGARLSRAAVHIYPHGDLATLESMLARNRTPDKIVITDGVFSMDGDIAPIPEMIALCERHDAMLLVDDAHGFGVVGPGGRGSLAHFGAKSERLLYMGTLGKAVGVAGAFVAGNASAIEWLVQRTRTYIFTTSMPPMLAAAIRASLDIVARDEWRRKRLVAHGRRLRAGLQCLPWGLPTTRTAIQPVLIGNNTAALAVMRELWERGIWAPAIRPPTVPEGTARLRITFSAAHEDAHIDRLIGALREAAEVCMARADAN